MIILGLVVAYRLLSNVYVRCILVKCCISRISFFVIEYACSSVNVLMHLTLGNNCRISLINLLEPPTIMPPTIYTLLYACVTSGFF